MPSQLELANKDEHIATLTDKKSELEIEIEVEKGVGYLPREKRKRGKLAIGEILIDAIYSPVKRVGYQVENMRVGERTDFDKLILDIETDGTISPSSALSQAAKILVDHFSLVAQDLEEEKQSITPAEEKKPRKAQKKEKKVKKTKKRAK